MTLSSFLAELKPLTSSTLFAVILTPVVSSLIGAQIGLWTFRKQSKELVDGAIAWKWVVGYNGENEEPFLVIQNRSAVPAYIIKARLLRGLFIRAEERKYAFDYVEVTDGNFPLEITAQGASFFPLSKSLADRAAIKAKWFSRFFAYVLKRPYLWIEITTISGHRMMIPANDVTSFMGRPFWLEGRWLRTK